MTVTSVRLDDEQHAAVRQLALFNGVSISAMLRDIIVERLQDEADYRDAARVLQSTDRDPISPSRLRAELGLPEPSLV